MMKDEVRAYAEQERIVTKVEQLLSLCDALETRLWEAREALGV